MTDHPRAQNKGSQTKLNIKMESTLMIQIIIHTAAAFAVTTEDLTAHSKGRIVVDARHMAIYIAKRAGEYPERIAAMFGVSVQAVHYGAASMAHQIERVPALRKRRDSIETALSNIVI